MSITDDAVKSALKTVADATYCTERRLNTLLLRNGLIAYNGPAVYVGRTIDEALVVTRTLPESGVLPRSLSHPDLIASLADGTTAVAFDVMVVRKLALDAQDTITALESRIAFLEAENVSLTANIERLRDRLTYKEF